MHNNVFPLFSINIFVTLNKVSSFFVILLKIPLCSSVVRFSETKMYVCMWSSRVLMRAADRTEFFRERGLEDEGLRRRKRLWVQIQ